jgi:hypothetical protein
MSSTHPAREKPPTRATADPPGEVPADLKAAGWTLKEHVNDAGEYQLHNQRLKKKTSPYATPQLAFDAARQIQQKGKTEKGAAEGQRVAVSRNFSQPLKTRLADADMIARLGDWRTKRAKKAEIEAEAKQVADGYKAQVGKLDSEIKAIEKALVTQVEERDVQCEERMDYGAKRVYVVRLDTGEEVEGQARPMTQKELQPTLLKM